MQQSRQHPKTLTGRKSDYIRHGRAHLSALLHLHTVQMAGSLLRF